LAFFWTQLNRNLNQKRMLKIYFKIAWRDLTKNKPSSLINISGLSIGMAVALLIGLWIWDELSFDTNNSNYRHIAQIVENQTLATGVNTMEVKPYPLAKELRDKFGTDFKQVAAFTSAQQVIAAENKKLTRTGGFADPQFPGMMTLKMLEGTNTALNDPTSILVSSSLANAIFGDQDPVGKTIRVGDTYNLQIKGVYADLPDNSTFKGLDFVAPVNLLFGSGLSENDWYTSAFDIYVQLNAGSNPQTVSAKIAGLLQQHNKSVIKPVLILYPMNKWHLYSEFQNGVPATGSIRYCWMFGFIGVFILLLASINFMNLATARSQKRAKEVGIRKAVGSGRNQLITQFFGESVFMVACAFVLALCLAQLLLPFFDVVSGKKMIIPWASPLFWIFAFVFMLIMGFLSGSYPALYLSSFNPVKVLKGTFQPGRSATTPRKVLVVVQFTVSIGLAFATMVVYRQIQFAKDRPLGYDQNRLITVPLNSPNLNANYNALRVELLKTGAVVNLTESSSPTTGIASAANNMVWRGKDPNYQAAFGTISSSSDYGPTVGWNIIQGRDFSAGLVTDSLAFVLNEAAVKQMGLVKPVGERVRWHDKDFTIIGVARDMVMTSPFLSSMPTVFMMNTERSMNVIEIKLAPNQPPAEALSVIGAVFRKFNPDAPFDYQFEDEQYAAKFTSEQRIGNLARGFSLLALFISCIGIFGMASFVAEQRTKEIGVRKVLGASVVNLWALLCRDFVVLVLISAAIASPVAYHFMRNWLQHYQYRTAVVWWIFVAAGGGVLVITILTVSIQSIKAATASPVKSLRSE
jgi:putative ABC transport system permease protein